MAESNTTAAYVDFIRRSSVLTEEIAEILKSTETQLSSEATNSYLWSTPVSKDGVRETKFNVREDDINGFNWSSILENQTSHNQIKNLTLALACCPPTALDVCVFTFDGGEESNYIWRIQESLTKILHPKKLSPELSKICAELNGVLCFILHDYQPKKSEKPDNAPYSDLIKQEKILKELLLNIMKDSNFPIRATILFVFSTNLYLLMVKELAIFDPNVGRCEDSNWIKTFQIFSRMSVKHGMTVFSELWRLRMDSMSQVDVKHRKLKNQRGPKEHMKYKVSSSFKDDFRDEKSFLASKMIVSGHMINRVKGKVELDGKSGRGKYMQTLCFELDASLHFPMQCSSEWLKFMTHPISRSLRDRLLEVKLINPLSDDATAYTDCLPLQHVVSFSRLPKVPCRYHYQFFSEPDAQSKYPYVVSAITQKGIETEGTLLIEMGALPISSPGIKNVDEKVFERKFSNLNCKEAVLHSLLTRFNLPVDHLKYKVTTKVIRLPLPSSDEEENCKPGSSSSCCHSAKRSTKVGASSAKSENRKKKAL